MGQLYTLAFTCKHYSVITHYITAAERCKANFAFWSRASMTVSHHLFNVTQRNLPTGCSSLAKAYGSTRRCIHFMTMMHLDDFQIKIWPQDFRCLASEPKERVHASGIITRPNDGNRGLVLEHLSLFFIRVAGGANDQRLAVLRAQSGAGGGSVVQTEINDGITISNVIGEAVAFVYAYDDIESVHFFSAGNEHLAHPAFGTMNDDLGHEGYLITPVALSVARSWRRLSGFSFTSGRRYSSFTRPFIASADFTGTGLVSIKRSLKSG